MNDFCPGQPGEDHAHLLRTPGAFNLPHVGRILEK